MERFRYRSGVPLHHTDELGNWHSPYFFFAFFEARKALFESEGITAERLKDQQLAVVVGELQCSYLVPLRAYDEFLIELAVNKLGRSSMVFSCEVYDHSRTTLCAKGNTTQILISTEHFKSVELPLWIRAPLERYRAE